MSAQTELPHSLSQGLGHVQLFRSPLSLAPFLNHPPMDILVGFFSPCKIATNFLVHAFLCACGSLSLVSTPTCGVAELKSLPG